MDFDPVNHPGVFRRGLYPENIREVTKNWSTLDTYIYVISKKFNPFSNNKNKKLNTKLNLVKIGFSSLKTRQGDEKLFARLLGFRTSLISFDVHRFYLYNTDQNVDSINSAEAHTAEQRLHEIVESKFKKATRIQFSSLNNSEWFAVPLKEMKNFLTFCDKAIFNKISPNVVAGTKFNSDNTSEPITIKVGEKLVGVQNKSGKIVRKENARITTRETSRNSNSVEQHQEMIDQIKRQKFAKKKRREENSKVAKNVGYWKKIFMPEGVGREFFDREMYPGDKKWGLPKKIIIDVIFRNQVLILYEPNKRRKTVTETRWDGGSGHLTVNEALEYFNKLKADDKESYLFYKRKNASKAARERHERLKLL